MLMRAEHVKLDSSSALMSLDAVLVPKLGQCAGAIDDAVLVPKLGQWVGAIDDAVLVRICNHKLKCTALQCSAYCWQRLDQSLYEYRVQILLYVWTSF